MDWKSLILDLKRVGVTQQEIGREIDLSQPAVSDLARGRTHEVSWSVGQRLIALHAERCGVETPEPMPEGAPRRPSSPRPLSESGPGAKPESSTTVPVSTAAPDQTGGCPCQGGARKTAAGERREVA